MGIVITLSSPFKPSPYRLPVITKNVAHGLNGSCCQADPSDAVSSLVLSLGVTGRNFVECRYKITNKKFSTIQGFLLGRPRPFLPSRGFFDNYTVHSSFKHGFCWAQKVPLLLIPNFRISEAVFYFVFIWLRCYFILICLFISYFFWWVFPASQNLTAYLVWCSVAGTVCLSAH